MFRKLFFAFLTAIYTFVFVIALPYINAANAGGTSSIYEKHERKKGGGIIQGRPGAPKEYSAANPLPDPDLSEPDWSMKYSWARIAGREDAVYLNIPSNQISDTVILASEPNPILIVRYDEAAATASLALMRMRQVGNAIQAGIYRISPRNFQHFMGPSFYNFAWLNWEGEGVTNPQPNCKWGQNFIRNDTTDLPQYATIQDIIKSFQPYDMAVSEQTPIYTDKGPKFGTLAPIYLPYAQDIPKINRADSYWHQRINTSPCWSKTGLKDFDIGDGNFHKISLTGLLKLIALTQEYHGAPVAFTAFANYRLDSQTTTKKSFFKKRVTLTKYGYLKPKWLVSTRKMPGMTHSDMEINTTWDLEHGAYSFVWADGEGHTFPMDEMLVWQESTSKSGWTGLFVFVAAVVIAVVTSVATGGTGMMGGVNTLLSSMGSSSIGINTMVAGLITGAIGGGIAVGGPGGINTNTTAELTSFRYSVYDLENRLSNISGDNAKAVREGVSKWLAPDLKDVGGGVQVFATKIDIRRSALCGGASKKTDDCKADPGNVNIVELPMNHPKFNEVWSEMFTKPHELLQKYVYPFEHKPTNSGAPQPPQIGIK